MATKVALFMKNRGGGEFEFIDVTTLEKLRTGAGDKEAARGRRLIAVPIVWEQNWKTNALEKEDPPPIP